MMFTEAKKFHLPLIMQIEVKMFTAIYRKSYTAVTFPGSRLGKTTRAAKMDTILQAWRRKHS